MNHRSLRRGLAASLAAVLVLPIVLVVTLGAATLLAAVGDAAAAGVLRWVALGVGLLWGIGVVITAAVSAMITLVWGGRLRHGRRQRRRRVGRNEPGQPA